jgi:hypothetical protein
VPTSLDLTPRGLRWGGILVAAASAAVGAIVSAPHLSHDDVRQMYVLISVAVMGVLASLFRTGVALDRARDEVVVWWGLVVPLGRRRRRLSGLTALEIREERRVGDIVVHLWPIRLVGAEPPLLVIDGSFSEGSARKTADRLATFLALPGSLLMTSLEINLRRPSQ